MPAGEPTSSAHCAWDWVITAACTSPEYTIREAGKAPERQYSMRANNTEWATGAFRWLAGSYCEKNYSDFIKVATSRHRHHHHRKNHRRIRQNHRKNLRHPNRRTHPNPRIDADY